MRTDASPAATGGRHALVLRVLLDALPTLIDLGGAVRVLDCGGGSGTYAVPLAAADAEVTVVDLSADALATLRRRAEEARVSGAVRGLGADVEALEDVLAGERFDLVLAHGILEAVDDVRGVFGAIAAATRPGGLISVLAANPSAAVVARAVAGDLPGALGDLRALEMRRLTGSGADTAAEPAADPAAVSALAAELGLVVEARRGVGVFGDLVPGAALDTPAARDVLDELDAVAADLPDYSALAARIHLLLRRPLG